MVTLYLLGAQREVFRGGTVIAAYTVIDARNHVVSSANTQKEAQAVVDRFAAKYPKTTFHIVKG